LALPLCVCPEGFQISCGCPLEALLHFGRKPESKSSTLYPIAIPGRQRNAFLVFKGASFQMVTHHSRTGSHPLRLFQLCFRQSDPATSYARSTSRNCLRETVLAPWEDILLSIMSALTCRLSQQIHVKQITAHFACCAFTQPGYSQRNCFAFAPFRFCSLELHLILLAERSTLCDGYM
jgi:hypothetical protein